nr:DUF3795 domain-containing protein [Faecalicatena faecalis]
MGESLVKNFIREDLLFSLCGLNCGLCTMHLDGYCPGCGGGEGNQSCKIAKCSLEHGKIEYCFQCRSFPCEKYDITEEYDSFITHRNRFKDFEKIKALGIEAYKTEQIEKTEILADLLKNYNDGRKKTFFCLAVNLLELDDLQAVMEKMKTAEQEKDVSVKEKALYLTELIQETASQKSVILKLRRKPPKNKEK